MKVAAGMEVELKLALLGGEPDALIGHRAFAVEGTGKPRRVREVTTYFDTDDLALAGEGVSLRVRRRGKQHVQTLKSRGETAGIALRRGEWEWPVANNRPDLSRLAETPIATRLPAAIGDDLKPVVTTDVERTIWTLSCDGGAVIEAALDNGTISAGTAGVRIRELELELKHGAPAALYRVALELSETTPLAIESESKADRGYRLRTGLPPVARKARTPRFARDANAAQAFRALLMSGLGHMVGNQPAAAAGDVEGVHQVRVAIRSLRATLTLFSRLLDRRAAAGFNAELRRLGRLFGEARDLDVFCDAILPRAFTMPADGAVPDRLTARVAERRRDARQRVAEELRSPAMGKLILALAVWAEDGIENPATLGDPCFAKPVAELAPDLLGRLARKVAARGRQLDSRSEAELHALRKSLKKLRQGTIDLGCLYPRGRVKDYLRASKDMLDQLGRLQDATMAEAVAERLRADDPAALGPAVKELGHWTKKRRRRAIKRLPATWRALRDLPPVWA